MTAEPTELLLDWSRGEPGALDRLLSVFYRDLREMALLFLRRERLGHTLQPTELVHEAYLRLVGREKVSLESRHQLMSLLAQTMRRVLIDHARRKKAGRRRGDLKTALSTTALKITRDRPDDLLLLDEALSRLAEFDPRQARVVELRYFGGYSVAETAEILQHSRSTIKRDWAMAKAWLFQRLRGDEE